jgi:hypothetical protein
MAKTKISEYDSTAANNTDVDSVNIAEGCAPSGINNAIREVMSHLKDFQTGAAGDSLTVGGNFSVTGTVTIPDNAISGDKVEGGTINAITINTLSANPTLSAGTANGITYLNGSKVLTSGSGLTFDGTNLGVGTSSPTLYVGKVVVNGHQSIIGGSALFLWDSGNAYAPSIYAPSDSIAFRNNAGSEQMRLTSTGLGIGTSSNRDSNKLDVRGNIAFGSNVSYYGQIGYDAGVGSLDLTSSDGAFRFIRQSGSVTSMLLNSSGNLGLGVTPSGWGSGQPALQIGSGTAINNRSAVLSQFSSNQYWNGSNHIYLNNGTATLYTQNDGAHSWATAPSGSAGGTISFTQAMTLDASGNLGVGTTSPESFGGGHKTLELSGSTTTEGGVFKTATSGSAGSGSSGTEMIMFTDSVGGKINVVSSHPAIFYTANTERMRIDTSGNVGIGTSSPNFQLSFGANIGKTIALFENAGTSVYGIGMGGAGTAGDPYRTKLFSNGSERIAITDAGNLLVGDTTYRLSGITSAGTAIQLGSRAFIGQVSGGDTALGGLTGSNFTAIYQGGTEAMRIDSSGRTLIGISASRPNGGVLQVSAQGQTGIVTYTTSTTYNNAAYFENGNGIVGSIATNGSGTSYNTSSDYRLKEDWVTVADASTRVNALKPVNFAWKVDGKRVDGFLAHELAEVVPEAVTGEKDAVDADGNPKYQGIDQSKLVPLLTAALQEALAKIESLTARVSALEGN